MQQVETEIEIAAAPEAVWRVLTDFAAYPEWNPFIRSIEGSAQVGAQLTVRIGREDTKPMTFRPRVLAADANRELRWLGRMFVPGLFDGTHAFVLESADGGTRLRHCETFRGFAAWLMPAGTYDDIRAGFEDMNAALKTRAEAAA